MATAAGDLIQTTSSSSSTGTITLAATASDAKHQPFPASFNGQTIAYLIQHQSIEGQFELGEGVYTHSGRTLTRPAANVVFGTAGAGANTDFSVGGLLVSNVAKLAFASVSQFGLVTPAQMAALNLVTPAARTSTFTAVAGSLEEIDTSGGAFACSLPATPTRGMRAAFIDKTDTWDTNALTIQRNGSTIEGLAEDIIASGGKLVQLYYDGSTWRFEYSGGIAPLTVLQEVLIIAASDETSGLIEGAAKAKFRMPWAMNVTAVRASVGTAPEGAAIIVDINEVVGGVATSILGTKLSIDDGEKTSKTAAVPATITDATLADDAEITIDIDQTGSTIAGAGLKVQLHGIRV